MKSVVKKNGEKIDGLARKLSYHGIQNENGELINPFLRVDHPLLDPNSDKFSSKAWLQTIMGITPRDPKQYPKGVVGVTYKNLSAYGYGEPTEYQKNFGNYPFKLFRLAKRLVGRRKRTRIQILRDFNGLIKSGEMLVVLGRPGSGCSTFLKTISGEADGFYVEEDSYLNYQGTQKETIYKDFRGECIYQAKVDVHLPQLTVGQTLEFAARARAPRNRMPGVSRDMYAKHLQDILMAMFGLSHTVNTMTGNDFIRGVSGGEKKVLVLLKRKYSLPEEGMSVVAFLIHLVPNAIAGTPLQCWDNSTRRLNSAIALEFVRELRTSTEPTGATAIVFDKVTILYEGCQIYFRDVYAAKTFFVSLGFECPPRQTTADFLTSLTNPAKQVVRKGLEGRTPCTPDEFAAVWRKSEDRARLLQEIEDFDAQLKALQARSRHVQSLYIISVSMQVKLCVQPGYQTLQGDMALVITSIIFDAIMALVIGNGFYDLPNNTSSLYDCGALLFAILLPAFASALEILTLYAQRPILEKQSKYAFYHSFAEAVASMMFDLPNKIGTAIGFVSLISSPSLLTVTYIGFIISTKDMHPWFRWLNYLNPVGYAFESLMINEFHGRTIPCTQHVRQGPGYGDVSPDEKICATTGATAGADFVDGDTYLAVKFHYHGGHLWRNFGIMIALMVFGCFVYLVATEYISVKKSKGESKLDEESDADDRVNIETIAREESVPDTPASIQKQSAVFHWDSVNHDIKIKGKSRRLLDDVDSWVVPGTLTALMGVTGAGKTTLLDVLANRVTMGVVSGQILLDGRPATHALTFSALLRPPKSSSHAEKIEYVDKVMKVLEMEAFADAVVGVSGEGLNVEQRKRSTIGVELAARPALLLVLYEPTSDLDSQTAWSICVLLRKLADNGQAILCTIHQPSAILFQEIDRLLFLAMGGKTLYFGEIGKSSKTFTSYFERNGTRFMWSRRKPCRPALWKNPEERKAVKAELARIKEELSQLPILVTDADALRPFAALFDTQFSIVPMQGCKTNSTPSLCSLQFFSNFCTQIMPHFVTQRALYGVREFPSKTYSWRVFILSNILVEIPWNSLMAMLIFVSWYYPIGLRHNAVEAGQGTEGGALMILFVLAFMIFAGTFTHTVLAGLDTAEAAGSVTNLLFSISLIFCGVLATPDTLPSFWIFVYLASPFSYLMSGMLSVGLANSQISCSSEEFLRFGPPSLSNCSNYLAPYVEAVGGYLTLDSMNSTTKCVFCGGSETNIFLKGLSAEYGDRWRNFGIFLVYVCFNVAAANRVLLVCQNAKGEEGEVYPSARGWWAKHK
ncbi:ABC transporter-like protein [Lojkania enalia]|uniref:ABC transporter-like protein n=1 Tax=Lojkania enalia TaxID=147567 RepID=A0A9P4NBX0_9PLEO|nr:ABC transporter-like protein [Didymosphaeria enalia]